MNAPSSVAFTSRGHGRGEESGRSFLSRGHPHRLLVPAPRAAALRRGVSLALSLLPTVLAPAPLRPDDAPCLRIDPGNPLHFLGPDGRPVLLIGAYTWGTFSDADYDYQAMFDTLQAHGLNFARLWLWWGCERFPPPGDNLHVEPFLRPGPGQANDGRPRYDLTKLNPAFFARLRDLCAVARDRGLFLQLVTMDAWMLKHPHLWKLHAFHRDNNVNGVNGDPRHTGAGTDGEQGFCSLGNRTALEFQKSYLRRLVEVLAEFDNILIEIANENFYSPAWERALCEFIRECERPPARQHVLMPLDLANHFSVVQTWDVKRVHAVLVEKRRLGEPLIFDTDWTITENDGEVRRAAWTAVLSGAHFNYMDASFQIGGEWQGDVRGSRRAALHREIGYLAAFVRQVRFSGLRPDGALVSSLKEADGAAFAMASESELAAYLPDGGQVTLDVARLDKGVEVHWFNPRDGLWAARAALPADGRLAPPGGGDWALLARRITDGEPPRAPEGVTAAALAPSSVWLRWRGGRDNAAVAGYRVFRDGQPLGTSVLPGFTDWGLSPQRSYAYTVTAFDLSGNTSPPSAPAAATTPARAPFCRVTLGARDTPDRLRHVRNRDGDTAATTAGGRSCRQPAGDDDYYFYFAIDDAHLFQEPGLTVRLEVAYLDEEGFIEPQYDSVTSPYTNARRVSLARTGEWQTATWTLRDCRFANRQNAGADFRLHVGEQRVRISQVTVTVLGPEGGSSSAPRGSN